MDIKAMKFQNPYQRLFFLRNIEGNEDNQLLAAALYLIGSSRNLIDHSDTLLLHDKRININVLADNDWLSDEDKKLLMLAYSLEVTQGEYKDSFQYALEMLKGDTPTTSPYKKEYRNERIYVTAPYSERFRIEMGKIGGRWDNLERKWVINKESEELLDKALLNSYGYSKNMIKVKYLAWDFYNSNSSDIRLGSLIVANRKSRDYRVSFYHNTSVVDGKPFASSGGSRNNPEAMPEEDTVLISEIPMEIYEKLSEEKKKLIDVV